MQLKEEIKNVHRYTWGYNLIKTPVDFCLRRFYSKIEFDSAGEKYFNQPCIYIINHQNTFIDALMLVYQSYKRQITFIARADVFQKPLARKILLYLKILPIFRERDGVDLTTENQVIIDQCTQILKDYKSFGIFPEGTHHGKYFIRPLKKGTARMAFSAAESMQFSRPIYIIPTGIYYSDVLNGNSRIYVNHGEIIDLTDYYSLYKENPAKAITTLTKEMYNRMRDTNLHVSFNESHYDLVNSFMTALYAVSTKKAQSVKEEFFVKKSCITSIEQKIQKLSQNELAEMNEAAQKFDVWLKTNGVKENAFNRAVRAISNPKSLYFEFFFFFPLALMLKLIIDPIQKMIQNKVSKMTKKDVLFGAALKFGFGMPVMLIYSILLSLLFNLIFDTNAGFFLLILFPFFYNMHNYFKELRESVRAYHLLKKSVEFNQIQQYLKRYFISQ